MPKGNGSWRPSTTRTESTPAPGYVYKPLSAFGASDNPAASPSGSVAASSTGFTGASTPNATGGMVYLRNRWYDPATGRFLTQDPLGLGGGANLYAYAGNDPVSFSDPFGLDPCKLLGPCEGDSPAQRLVNWVYRKTGSEAVRTVVAAAGAALEAVGTVARATGLISDAHCTAGACDSSLPFVGPGSDGTVGDTPAPVNEGSWRLGAGRSPAKWASQMAKRGWTSEQITEAIESGAQHPAENRPNPGNPATRYVHPKTGRSVVVDDVTNEVIHVGGDGFKY